MILSLCIIILKGKCILHFVFVPDVSVLTLSGFKMLADANHFLLIFEIMGSVQQFVQILSRSGYIYINIYMEFRIKRHLELE